MNAFNFQDNHPTDDLDLKLALPSNVFVTEEQVDEETDEQTDRGVPSGPLYLSEDGEV